MSIDLSVINNPKIKALVTGAFLFGGIVFSLLTYFMIISSKPQPVEIKYNCSTKIDDNLGETLGTESTAPTNNISTLSPKLSQLSQSGSLVNINTATVAQLDKLPGIGPAYAEKIIEYRQTNGDFTSTQELMRVKGIGQKTYDELKDFVVTK